MLTFDLVIIIFRNKYSNVTAWNISGPIIVMRVSGQADSSMTVKLDKQISFKIKIDSVSHFIQSFWSLRAFTPGCPLFRMLKK